MEREELAEADRRAKSVELEALGAAVSDAAELRNALRQLRHLYEQMLDGRVTDTAVAARGLLGPAIERVERVADRMVHP